MVCNTHLLKKKRKNNIFFNKRNLNNLSFDEIIQIKDIWPKWTKVLNKGNKKKIITKLICLRNIKHIYKEDTLNAEPNTCIIICLWTLYFSLVHFSCLHTSILTSQGQELKKIIITMQFHSLNRSSNTFQCTMYL